MMDVLWATRQYWVWLALISLGCMLLEALLPWRKQKLLRKQFGQDVVWLVLNGHYIGIAVAFVGSYLLKQAAPVVDRVQDANLLAEQPLWLQFIVFLLFKDLLEWGVHNLLHRVPALWAFHKLHHSIEELDWIGNFRFHWMEVVIYHSITYFPLVLLGVNGSVILWIAITATVIGHLNHSNLNITWGPLRYVINSPRMHVWHHMYALPKGREHGVNFGIVLSVWDWLFGTVYWPATDEDREQQPDRLGFPDIESYPRSFVGRFVYPLRLWRRSASKNNAADDESN